MYLTLVFLKSFIKLIFCTSFSVFDFIIITELIHSLERRSNLLSALKMKVGNRCVATRSFNANLMHV